MTHKVSVGMTKILVRFVKFRVMQKEYVLPGLTRNPELLAMDSESAPSLSLGSFRMTPLYLPLPLIGEGWDGECPVRD